jgi:hypothetical protein
MATPNRGMKNAKMILVAGPYRSGTNDDPTLIAKNVEAMTEASLQLFRAGHLPVMGEWYALPLIEHAERQCTSRWVKYPVPPGEMTPDMPTAMLIIDVQQKQSALKH